MPTTDLPHCIPALLAAACCCNHCSNSVCSRGRRFTQPSMSSCDCFSARSDDGTLCSVKNCWTSSFNSALQNFLVEPTISVPLDMVIFFSTAGQCAFTHSQATF